MRLICAVFILLLTLMTPAQCQQTAVDLFNKGVALDAQGKYDEALQAFDKAIEINPQLAEAWVAKGVVLMAQGKYDEAIQAYDKAIEIDPQDVNVWNNKGVALNDLGKHNEAIQAYDKAIELDSNDALTWNNKGVALIGHRLRRFYLILLVI
jgi:tetratricopeptide (TPR) repeat protein